MYFLYLVVYVNPYKLEGNLVHTGCRRMKSALKLSDELRKLVEARIEHTIRGIEDTLQRILENQEVSPKDLKETIQGLEESFNLLSQKWNLQILYTLFLKTTMGFGELKKILAVNSRTLSDKLKSLKQHGYIERTVEEGPPLRVKYSLTETGKNTVLLALPLLYYAGSLATPQHLHRHKYKTAEFH
jgi:DNA-binding HxlR family transcriptional regulator